MAAASSPSNDVGPGVGVVEQVLLELIEQDVQLPAKLLEGRINPVVSGS